MLNLGVVLAIHVSRRRGEAVCGRLMECRHGSDARTGWLYGAFHCATGCEEHAVLSSSKQRICTGGMALGLASNAKEET